MSIRQKAGLSRSLSGNILMGLFLLLAGVFTAIPLVYVFVNAFKPINELFVFPPRLYVINPTLENFRALSDISGDMLMPFERYIFNSVFVSVAGTAVYIFLSSFAAYPLAKHKFPGKVFLLQIIIWAMLFRPEATAIPQFFLIAKLNMVDTYYALVFPTLAGSFGIFLMRQFIIGIPDDILEAARIDGLGEIGIYARIVMPVIKPAWITLMIFTFQALWNNTGVQYIYTENLKMLPTALQQLSTAGLSRAGVGSAVALLLLLPPVTIFVFCQRAVLETMAHSGIKS